VGGRGVTGGGSVELQWRSRFGWGRKWGGETGSQGEERSGGADLFCRGRGRGAARGRGAGGGAQSGFQRKKTARLTDRVGPPVNEGEATGRLGRKGREEMGRAGLENMGGGGPRLGWKRTEEVRPKPLLGLKSRRVKEN
jgi:hypothetical protein